MALFYYAHMYSVCILEAHFLCHYVLQVCNLDTVGSQICRRHFYYL